MAPRDTAKAKENRISWRSSVSFKFKSSRPRITIALIFFFPFLQSPLVPPLSLIPLQDVVLVVVVIVIVVVLVLIVLQFPEIVSVF